MYLFKVIEKMLAHEEENKLNENNKAKRSSVDSSSRSSSGNYRENSNKNTRGTNETNGVNGYSQDNKGSFKKKEYKKDNPVNKVSIDKKLMAYCLFADSGESFLAMHNDEKKHIFLNNISHKDKFTPESKTANQFINDHIKKKTVYLDIVEQLDNGDIIADVFSDKEKTYSVNQMLIDEGLHFSESKKYQKKEVSDMKVVDNTESNTKKELSQVDTSRKQTIIKSDPNKVIGYVKKFGKDNYLHKSENNLSYYITLEQDDKEITKWGVDLERVIQLNKIKINDYIELSKEQKLDNNQKKQFWNIKLLSDINQRYQENDGPPVEPSLESHSEDDGDYGYQEPYEWEHENDNDSHNESSHSYHTEEQYFSSHNGDSDSEQHNNQNEHSPDTQLSQSQENINNERIIEHTGEHDPMDDILSALDKPIETKKFNMKTN